MSATITSSSAATTRSNSPRRYIVFGIVALGLLQSSISSTIVVIAIPNIAAGLHAQLVWVGWVITGYQLAQAVAMPLAGRLSEVLGQKRLFLLCVGIFTLSALAAGGATSMTMLIISRSIMGVGGGALLPTAAAIVGNEFPKRRAQAIGLFSSIFPIGAVIGPTVGGLVLQQLSWRWTFYMNIPIGLLILLLSWRLLRESEQRTRHHLDLIGAVMLSVAILSFMLGLSLLGGDHAVSGVIIWGLLAASLALVLVFWRYETRSPEPILDLDLLRLKPFIASNAFNAIFGATVFGFFSFVPLYAVLVYGLSTFQSGSVLIARGVVMIVASSITSLLLLDRLSYRILIIAGMIIISITMLIMGAAPNGPMVFGIHVSDYWLLTGVLALGGFGTGLQNPPSNNAGMELMPSKVAAISGLRGMFRNMGGVISTTIIFSLLEGYTDRAAGLRHIFLALGLLIPLVFPLVMLMPTGREKPLQQASGPKVAAKEPGPQPR